MVPRSQVSGKRRRRSLKLQRAGFTDEQIAEGNAETIRWVVAFGFAQVAMILAMLRPFPSVHP